VKVKVVGNWTQQSITTKINTTNFCGYTEFSFLLQKSHQKSPLQSSNYISGIPKQNTI